MLATWYAMMSVRVFNRRLGLGRFCDRFLNDRRGRFRHLFWREWKAPFILHDIIELILTKLFSKLSLPFIIEVILIVNVVFQVDGELIIRSVLKRDFFWYSRCFLLNTMLLMVRRSIRIYKRFRASRLDSDRIRLFITTCVVIFIHTL